jgi:PhnO protein
MTDNVQIIKPDSSHMDGIFLLLKQLWPGKEINTQKVSSIITENSSSPFYEYLVAKSGETVVAFVSFSMKNNIWQEGKIAHIDEFIVHENYRARGIGTLILNETASRARSLDCKKIEVDSGLHRNDSHEFYKSWGFRERAIKFTFDL